MKPMNRRRLLRSAAVSPLALAGSGSLLAGNAAAQGNVPPPPPKYTLSANLELMFPRSMPHDERIDLIAGQGLKAFSFWGAGGKDLDAMLRAQKRTGLACGSITGNGKTGWNTGLTKTGYEQAFLDDIAEHIETAKKFGVRNLITFVGEVQKEIPWETQYRQVIAGLRKAGDLAEKHDVYVCLEPLNSVESPQMSVLSAKEGFKIVAEVDHPRVKLDFDMYHLQLSEGNLINNLRLGLGKGWIRFVEIGDVPGRFEPGTGEVNHDNIFRVLRELGYAGYVGLEHRSTSTPEHAIQVVKRVAGFS
jgi:hydroxypyruvate isomerase